MPMLPSTNVLDELSRFSPPGARYFSHLPLRNPAMLCTLGEGNTPLVRSERLGPELGIPELYFKLESTNPSGSYKDRLMALEVSLMREDGCDICLGPSTGNAGAALAAYAARFKIRCFIFATEKADDSKLQQMLFYGARVQRIRGFGESSAHSAQVFEGLQQLAARHGAHLVCSAFRYNPVAMEAIKTISFEICEQINGRALDHVFVPIAGGGLISAMWKGFREFRNLGKSKSLPKMNGVQSAGCPVVVRAVRRGEAPEASRSSTVIGPLAASFAPDGELAVRSIHESDGWGYDPTDEEIFDAQRQLALKEGIFAEPTAAASLAGLIRARKENKVSPDERVVCLISGHGFKDPDSIMSANRNRVISSIELDQLLAGRFPID